MNSKTKPPFAKVRSIVTHGIICLLLFTAVSCRSTNEEEKEPVYVPFTELSLSGGERAQEWIFQDAQPEHGNLVIINSQEVLENYTFWRTRPHVDFSKYTVLLVYGTEDYFTSIVDKSLQRISRGNYVMNVTLQPYTVSSARSHWHVAITTDKLDENSHVALNITRNEKKETIEVPFTELSLSLSGCIWNWRYGRDRSDTEVIIVNSDSELRPHLDCWGDYTLPDINFSEHSLLLATGVHNVIGIGSGRPVAFQQTSTNTYRLDIEVTPSDLPVVGRWYIGFITSKWNTENKIEINKTIIR